MEKAYKFRIYPNKTQENLIQKTFGCVRFVFNFFLDKRIKAYEADNMTLSYNEISTELVKHYDVICIEDLQIKNMVRNHKLARSIADVSWGEFFCQLTYKAQWYGKELVKVDTFYPSSQTCHVCGYRTKETKDLSVREWNCPTCHTKHDRDVNAAINILNEGKRILGIA